VAKVFDLLQDENNYYVFMEFCPNGELFEYICQRDHLTDIEARLILQQLLLTIQYCHKQGVTHRDLKPENILFSADWKIKISDFGLSNFLGSNDLVETPCGSPCYASPECISSQKYSGVTTDLWSIGVTFFVMLTGQLPWTKCVHSQLFPQIGPADSN
jgi:serine/threonine protein kinase